MIKDKISYWCSMEALEFLDCYKWKSENNGRSMFKVSHSTSPMKRESEIPNQSYLGTLAKSSRESQVKDWHKESRFSVLLSAAKHFSN